MSKNRPSALRRLESHNKSPHIENSADENHGRKERETRESRPRERLHSRGHSSREDSRHRSRSNDEERAPRWAQQLLDAQRESDKRLKTLEKEVKATNKQSGRKREHSPVAEFKFKRNRVQYDLNKSVLNKIEAALDVSDDEERRGALDEGRELLIERNKHIKLAEKYGWETVDCYIDEPLASDSDDDKKIRRAIKESKALKEEKRKAARTTTRLPVNVQSSRVGAQLSAQRNSNDGNFRQVIKRPSGSLPSFDSTCFRCGRKGHIARACRALVAINDAARSTTNQ